MSAFLLGAMTVIKVKGNATGLFALSADIKVKKGSVCELRRNRDNAHGKFALNLSYHTRRLSSSE